MKLLFVFLVTWVVTEVNGQAKMKFHSQNYLGLLEGERGSYFQLQTINGLQSGTWFGGLGTGVDYYYFRSVPLFLSFNKDFCSCRRTFFVSADGGLNFVWDGSTGNDANGWRKGDFNPAAYWAGGIGYKIGMRNQQDALLMNIGFSSKHIREKVPQQFWCDFPPCPVSTERLNYKLNRLSIRVGWQF